MRRECGSGARASAESNPGLPGGGPGPRALPAATRDECLRRIIDMQSDLTEAGLDADAMRQLACERAQELTGADGAAILALEEGWLIYRSATGCLAGQVGLARPLDGFDGLIDGSHRSRVVADSSCGGGYCDVRDAPAVHWLAAALLDQCGETAGVVQVCSPRAGAFDDAARQTVELISIVLSAALSRASEVDARRAEGEAVHQFRTIFELAPIGIAKTDAAGRVVTINPALQRLLGYSAAELAESGFEERPEGAEGWTSCDFFAELIGNAHDPWACDSYQVEKRLVRKQGEPIWVQVTARLARHPDGTPAYGLAMIENISRRRAAEDALKQEAERNQHQALHDPLTGLANRVLFRDRVRQTTLRARREDGFCAVLLMDVDRFKEINDSLGHQAGDVFLVELASRLRASLRESDTIARLGGDEFGILLPDRGSPEAIHQVIRRITEAVEQPVILDGVQLVVEASIGVARYPDDGDDVDTLLQRADIAMYTAKRSSCGHAFYNADTDRHHPQRLSLVGELRRAIAERELVLHYQPKAHLATAEVRSVEALVRWEHPTRGLIMPGDFIPLAQETGLMTPLTAYVLEEALRACRAWRADGLPLSVAVNVSERNLLDAGFPDQVESLLRSVGADATWLELELTESAALRDPVRAQHVLDRLAGRGIRISIDDFGSGYTSLSQLTRLPIAEIKIDRSFVGDMPSQKHAVAVVRMVVEFARSVGLDVVAEGVESRETWEQLAALGCTLAQGYFLSRPLPEAALLRWLAQHDATGRRVTPAATCR